ITPNAIQRLLSSPCFTDSFKLVSASHGLAMPLNFSSPLAELNLLSILSLLNFASGYRVPLHTDTGRGAWDNMRAFVFSMFLSSSVGDGDLLSAKGMQTISTGTVTDLMRVTVHIERPHETIPALTVGELGGPLYELVKLITKVLTETGEILVHNGYPDLGSFIAETLNGAAKASSKDIEIELILEKIVSAIPAFQDIAIVNGEPVYCFKKALFLIHAINIRFGSLAPPPFPIPSTGSLPVFTDNVLPSMLIHLGVIDLSESSLSHLFPGAGSSDKLQTLLAASNESQQDLKDPPEEGPVLNSSEAYILRAAAIDACELIVELAGSSIRLPDLDMWLWAIAKKRADFRRLPRFVLRDTIFF
ncbi:hypothetical protein C8J56DRAFT_778357, partial [Mycena floridula]